MEPASNNHRKTITDANNDRRIKMLLGLGFWIQGFRRFPWMAVIFFLKDGLRVDPSTMQILLNSAGIPNVAKPIYGLVSDSFYLFGQHRIPYIAAGALLQALSWFAIASSPTSTASTVSYFTITIYLQLSNLGSAIVEVASDAILAECAKRPTNDSDLRAFAWNAFAIGGIVGNLVGGLSIDRVSPRAMFFFFGLILILQFCITISISEKSLNLRTNHSKHDIRSMFSEVLVVLRRPEIYKPIIWFSASVAVIPSLTSSMFYYQTQHLHIESSVLGVSKVLGQITVLLWGVVYNRCLKSVSPRTLITSIQGTIAVLMVSDALFVNGSYRALGVPDSLYVVVVSALVEVVYSSKYLPFNVLVAKLCPPGCEGSLMAFVRSVVSLASIVSGYIGVTLASWVVSETDFSGLRNALLIQAACAVVPLLWSSFIPESPKPEGLKKEE